MEEGSGEEGLPVFPGTRPADDGKRLDALDVSFSVGNSSSN